LRRFSSPKNFFGFIRVYFSVSLGTSEATILSKRGSPRGGSQNGSNFNWPEVARTADGNGKLFEGKIFAAEPRTGNFHRALNKMRAIADADLI